MSDEKLSPLIVSFLPPFIVTVLRALIVDKFILWAPTPVYTVRFMNETLSSVNDRQLNPIAAEIPRPADPTPASGTKLFAAQANRYQNTYKHRAPLACNTPYRFECTNPTLFKRQRIANEDDIEKANNELRQPIQDILERELPLSPQARSREQVWKTGEQGCLGRLVQGWLAVVGCRRMKREWHSGANLAHFPFPPGHEFRFTLPLYNVSIPENSIGKTYVVPEERMGIKLASPDSNLDIRFRIMSGDRDKFFKAEERTVGDFCFLLIRTRTGNVDVLNRERKDRYVLEVRATLNRGDGKNRVAIMEADTTVVVTILDTNDLNPLFYPTEYEATVTEDTPLHRSILRVIAEDADLGRNGEIYYSFAEETDQFAVHPVSGVITLTRPLRYSERAVHELVVLAKDRGALFRSGGGNSRASTAKVTIRVRQVNLHSPEIYVHHLPDIVEHSNADIYAIVRVVDNDEGVHGQIASLDIVGGDPAGHFRVRPAGGPHSSEYNIEVLHLLDRETAVQGYNLTLRAMDRGVPQRYSYKFVPVHLADLNDNARVFSREIYEVKVPETAPINTPVIRLKVTDADEGRNALVFLEIVGGNEGGEFYVNAETGMLYTAVNLDAEKKAFYTLTVSAVDQGNAGTRKQSSAKVKINVVDTNDNDPTFEQSDMEVWIDENEPAGTSVVKITAKDRDSGENAYISYGENIHAPEFIDFPSEIKVNESAKIGTTLVRIRARDKDLDYNGKLVFCISSGDRDSVFGIDPDTGDLNVIGYLDRERESEYFLNVSVYDLGKPQKSASKMLPVTILDVNDNAPRFEKSLASFRISETALNGTNVWRANATDADLGENARVTYSLVTETNDFRVDPVTGVLTVFGRLDRERQEIYELRIRAQDHGGKGTDSPPLYSDALVRVTVDDVNDNAPSFALSTYTVKIREDVPIWTVVAVVDATDPDEASGGDIEYFLSDAMESEGYFKVDKVSGTIRTTQSLDFEERQVHTLTIVAKDRGEPSLSSETMVIIEVVDVNENLHAPLFDDFVVSASVFENQPVGTLVTTVHAKDADPLGGDSRIGYTIRGGDGIGIFSIDNEAVYKVEQSHVQSPQLQAVPASFGQTLSTELL
ncbi:Fat-like cadherin-related tumor suppressor like protein [Melipona quadrifasciata]|uniref:Fat-like cadherin-related tumor suppressor like protein n=1 Tax=Melipona quadrifasciata TaxID=166423 RepID=A0A0N0BE22_9HYME|nr:Fat-like cadherin-related tumor suppressor like protein [Melipona quadrifasciata]